MAYQTTYNERIAPPQPGVLAGGVESAYVTTGIAETPSPGIPFGRGTSQGTLSDQGVVLGGTLAGFRGVSVRDITLRGDRVAGAGLDAYLPPDSVGVIEGGDVWVEPVAAVAAHDPVYMNSTTGLFGNAAGAGIVGPLPGAYFKTSCGVGGRAILSLPRGRKA